MADSRKTRPKTPKITEFPAPEGADNAGAVPQEFQDPPEPQEAAAPPAPAEPARRGPPKKGEPTRDTDFFTKVAAVKPEDWGQRVYLYLYQLEPVVNLKQSGDTKYLMRYQEPIRDEHQIMLEQGSGRYRMILAQAKTSPQQSNELCRHDFEIYNPQYPPRIPREVWINDPRNRRWEALLPKEKPPAATGGIGEFVEVMRGVNEFRRELKEEMQPDTPPPTAPAAVAAPLDPFAAAAKILDMRADNPMVAILTAQQTASATALEAERERNFKAQEAARDREAKLQEKILDLTIKAATPTAAAPQKDMLQQLMEFSAIPDKLDPIKKLFGWGSNGDGGGRPAKLTAMELGQNIAMKILDSPISEGLGAWLGSLANRGGPAPQLINPGVNGAPAQPQQQPDSLSSFIAHTVNPALERMYLDGFPGGDFAAWMFEGYPDRLQELQAFKHPLMPGVSGARVIIAAYKQSPLWPTLGRKGEPAFIQFVNEFCSWKPEAEGDQQQEPEPREATTTNGAPPVIIDVEDMQEGRIS